VVPYFNGGTKSVWEQAAEENIWTYEEAAGYWRLLKVSFKILLFIKSKSEMGGTYSRCGREKKQV
jgi:hypothetical protein